MREEKSSARETRVGDKEVGERACNDGDEKWAYGVLPVRRER